MQRNIRRVGLKPLSGFNVMTMEWTDGAANVDKLREYLEKADETLRGYNET